MTSRTGVQAVVRVGNYTWSHIVNMYLIDLEDGQVASGSSFAALQVDVNGEYT